MIEQPVSISLSLSEATLSCAAVLGIARAMKHANKINESRGVLKDLERLKVIADRVERLALLLAAAAEEKLPAGTSLVARSDAMLESRLRENL